MSVPVMSEGIMSGVNWIRRNDRLSTFATVLTSNVFREAWHSDEQHVAAGEKAPSRAVRPRRLAR